MRAAFALLAAAGVHLLSTALLGRAPVTAARPTVRVRWNDRATRWLAQAGLAGTGVTEVALVAVTVASAAGAVAWAVFGALAPAAVVGSLVALAPLGAARTRRLHLRAEIRAAWPGVIEDVRVRTGSLGRSVPVALLEAGRRSPVAALRPAFEAAQREWSLSTDFERTVAVLQAQLADATADTVCETLLVAHQLGGVDLEHRLVALAEDRSDDLESRRDAEARQAGARFARWLVLAVPAGMALVGLSIGDGRAAYATRSGQFAVVAGLLLTGVCWVWATAIMRLPDDERVLVR